MKRNQEIKEKNDNWYADDKWTVKHWAAILLFLSGVVCAAYFKDVDVIAIRSYVGAYLGFSCSLSFLFWGSIYLERGYIKGKRSKRYYRKENPNMFLFLFLFEVTLPFIGMLVVGIFSALKVI